MKTRTAMSVLISALILASQASALAGEDETGPADALLRIVQDESDQTLFLRCCWARGRAGFHYCQEYGICETNPEAMCQGTGPAEGRSLDCGDEPPELPEGG